MAVPKRKTSKSRRNMRRSHHALKLANISMSKTSGAWSLPHQVCANGQYKGQQVIVQKSKENKEENSEE